MRGAESILTEFDEAWIREKGGDPVAAMKQFAEAGYRVKGKCGAYMSEN